MRCFRVSLRTLLIAMAVAALGIAAIINRTPIWASAFVTLTFVLVLASALLAILRPGTRMFWTPVAIVGLSYTLIIYSDWCENLHYRLVTTQATIKVWEWLNREHRAPRIRRPDDDGEPTGDEHFLEEVQRRRVIDADPFAPPLPASQLVGPAVLMHALDWEDSDMDALGSYYWSAQSLWTLVLAFGSGLVSWHFFRPRPGAMSQTPATPQSPSSPA